MAELCEVGEPFLGYRRLNSRPDYQLLMKAEFAQGIRVAAGLPKDAYTSLARYSRWRGIEWDYEYHRSTDCSIPVHFPAGILRGNPWLNSRLISLLYCHHLPEQMESLELAFSRILKKRSLHTINQNSGRTAIESCRDLASTIAWIRFWHVLGFGFLSSW
jgi:hypothetical protein